MNVPLSPVTAILPTGMLRSLLPTLGDRTVRKKIRELENEAGSLPIIFGVLFGKVVEQLVIWNPYYALRFGIAAAVTAVLFVYAHELRQRAAEAAEKASEATDGEG
jgi:hypothetical protein